MQIYPRHACREYLETVDKFGFTVDSVPQLEDISQILQVRPWLRTGVQPLLLGAEQVLNKCDIPMAATGGRLSFCLGAGTSPRLHLQQTSCIVSASAVCAPIRFACLEDHFALELKCLHLVLSIYWLPRRQRRGGGCARWRGCCTRGTS